MPSADLQASKEKELHNYVRKLVSVMGSNGLSGRSQEFLSKVSMMDVSETIDLLSDLVIDDPDLQKSVGKLKEIQGEDDIYLSNFIETTISSEFGSVSQMVKFGFDHASIDIDQDGVQCSLEIDKNNVDWSGGKIGITDVMYYDDPAVLDGLSEINLGPRSSHAYGSESHSDNLFEKLNSNVSDIYSKIMNSESLDKFDRIINNIFEGSIVSNNHGLTYIDPAGNEVNFKNMAAGMKIFGIIHLLMRKGFLHEGSLFLMDEPEIHLHPKWIPYLAEVIVLLTKEFGVKTVLSTHNPQLLLGIQTHSYLNGVNTRYYRLVESDGSVDIVDSSAKIEEIYSELADPLEKTNNDYWACFCD
ncbi:MAG: ATP-binding protein [archaeon]|nr:ATP-binding protein [archaeon]